MAHIAIPQISTPKSNFTDGDMIPIDGYALPNSTINIFLVNNYGNIQNSTQVMSNSTGYFNTSLGIPSHVIGGAWTLFAISGDSNFAMQLMVNFHGSNTPPFHSPGGFLPLKQFKLGIKPRYVQCRSDLHLIIKSEDGSPACVKPDAVSILYLRGWSIGPVHGDIIFVIKPNTSGKIYVKYANQLSDIDAQLNTRLYDGSTGHEIQTTNLKVSVLPPVVLHNENLTATYYLTSQNNTAIYWLQVTSCDFVPISVQSDSSQIHLSDLQNVMMSWKCPRPFVQYHITGTDGVDAVYVNDTG